MAKVKGRVVKVEHPRIGCSKGVSLVTLIVAKKGYWKTDDDGITFDRVKFDCAKPVRFEIFYQGWPSIGEVITGEYYG